MSAGPQEPRRPGQVLSITSFSNPRIKAIQALALPKRRRESGTFIAEGLKLVADALDEGWPMETFIHAADAATQPMVQQTAARARARGADVLSVSAAVLGKVTRRDNPQTVVGVLEQRLLPPERIMPEPEALWVVLPGIRDPGNLGTIIRTADAAGASGVILVGETVDPFGVEAVRATMGSIFHVPLVRMTDEAFFAWRKGWPGGVVGTHLAAAEDYRTPPGRRPTLLLMGNEQSGLDDRFAAACDRLVRIPMAGRADSLNLAIATGIMLFELRRERLSLREAKR